MYCSCVYLDSLYTIGCERPSTQLIFFNKFISGKNYSYLFRLDIKLSLGRSSILNDSVAAIDRHSVKLRPLLLTNKKDVANYVISYTYEC